MKQDRMGPTFLALLCFFGFWKGHWQSKGLKITTIQPPCFLGKETEALNWGVIMLGEAGSPEKVKKE